MKRLFLALILICSNLLVAVPANVFAGANDFRFKDFTVDYYLRKTADNVSEMEVVENVTAVFPNYNQNHGIERYIPFLNQNDTNLTTENASNLSIEVTRNGEIEPVNVGVYDNHFVARIGRKDTYLHGEQNYKIKYKFVRVMTEFEASRYATEAYQELYWDTNGTESAQTFESVTANLHMDEEIKATVLKDRNFSKTPDYRNKSFISETNKTKEKLAAWCYVGNKRSTNQSRCKIVDLPDGISFSTGKLASGENLTFAVNFEDKTFTIPKNNYIDKLSVKKAYFDYFLSKDENNYSKLKVKGNLDVLFPSKDRENAFYFYAPYVNKSNVYFTTENQETFSPKVLFDGEELKNLKIEKADHFFKISIKPDNFLDDDFLHGEHKIELEYELKNIVLRANTKSNPAYKEQFEYQVFEATPLERFYHDVNNYIINVHLDNELNSKLLPIKDKLSNQEFITICDDGSHKNISQRSCSIQKNDDGFTFFASNISANSTSKFFNFFINFKEDTFSLPEPNRNFAYYHFFILLSLIIFIIIIIFYKRVYKKAKSNVNYLKNRPIVPEYTPHKNFNVSELAKNYLGYTKNHKVASFLELVVNKKIELKKLSSTWLKSNWQVKIIDDTNLSKDQTDLIKILNNGNEFKLGDEIKINQHNYSRKLEDCFNSYEKHLVESLKEKGCFNPDLKNRLVYEKYFTFSDFKLTHLIKLCFKFFFIYFIGTFLISLAPLALSLYFKITNFTPYSIFEGAFLAPIMIIMAFATAFILPVLHSRYKKYADRTTLGLDLSRYLDGLKLYIKMAEKDRLAFLQSLKTVDTTSEGIIKLNEKLLPYAALFGIEKSWMKELEQYYVLNEAEAPNWYASGLNYAALGAVNSILYTATARPIDVSSSTGSFSHSSGSSGGGGGGYSGGGGGGGGFGGW